jgi:hypothetical protein
MEKKSSIISVTSRAGMSFEADISNEACRNFKLRLKNGKMIEACHGDRFVDNGWREDQVISMRHDGKKGTVIGRAYNNSTYEQYLMVKLDKDKGRVSFYMLPHKCLVKI